MAPVSDPDLKAYLDRLVARYERPAFVADDPVAFPHAFDAPEDREVIGLFAALLAWGRRSVVLNKLSELLARMDHHPYRFVRDFRPAQADKLAGFRHRTFGSADAVGLVLALQAALDAYGSLGRLFALHLPPESEHIGPALQGFSDTLLTIGPGAPRAKHLPRPSTGSACKRAAMYVRWMVRPGPVDLGLWPDVSPALLVLPLDVHTGRQARHLGLLERRYDDWQAVLELTTRLRAFRPEDPARYDFALFGLGAYKGGMLNAE